MPSPGTIFIELWAHFSSPGQHITAAIAPSADFTTHIQSVLANHDDESVYGKLSNILTRVTAGGMHAEKNGFRLQIMQCIDEMFLQIHPRTVRLATGRKPLPAWLIDLRSHCVDKGYYEEGNNCRLIPRGPLTRQVRSHGAGGEDELAEHFPHLAVVTTAFYSARRSQLVTMIACGTDLFHGVTPRGAAVARGEEKILFIPVAEDVTDFEVTQRQVDGKSLLSFSISKTIAAPGKMARSINGVGRVDIAIAPEFATTDTELNALSTVLNGSGSAPRLTIAGSGNAGVGSSGAPFNEAIVLNSMGAVLWKQSKNRQSFMGNAAAEHFGIPPNGDDKHWEDNAPNDTIVVADVSGLGRCAVLICQDLKGDFISQLVAEYQPDWIFVPILDWGANLGRWAHRRCFELADKSKARFLVSCSMTMSRQKGHAETVIGLAHGPIELDDEDVDRAVAIVTVAEYDPAMAVLEWRKGGTWKQSTMGAA